MRSRARGGKINTTWIAEVQKNLDLLVDESISQDDRLKLAKSRKIKPFARNYLIGGIYNKNTASSIMGVINAATEKVIVNREKADPNNGKAALRDAELKVAEIDGMLKELEAMK